MTIPGLVECSDCEGQGSVPVGMNYVTRDMAVDAGLPEMAGESFEEFNKCPTCHGDCVVPDPDVDGSAK